MHRCLFHSTYMIDLSSQVCLSDQPGLCDAVILIILVPATLMTWRRHSERVLCPMLQSDRTLSGRIWKPGFPANALAEARASRGLSRLTTPVRYPRKHHHCAEYTQPESAGHNHADASAHSPRRATAGRGVAEYPGGIRVNCISPSLDLHQCGRFRAWPLVYASRRSASESTCAQRSGLHAKPASRVTGVQARSVMSADPSWDSKIQGII